ncbi:MAG: hypothetical protein ABI851_14800 [Saprospiraceae bacterium]
MIIERTKKEIIIKLPVSVDIEELQDFLDYARYKELTTTFKAPQKEVDKLASEINKDWWNKNGKKLVK